MSNILHSQEQSSGVLRHVARNVRALRQEKDLSQQDLADRAGISRRMVVSIEAGDVNVSLGKLDAIAIALGVSFTRIVSDIASPSLSSRGEIMWRGKSVESHAVLLGTAPARKEVEFWRWTLDANEYYQGEPDPGGYQEALIVEKGSIVLSVKEEVDRLLDAGSFTVFDSSKPYRYTNETTSMASFLRAVLN